jgi:hypothetical protein
MAVERDAIEAAAAAVRDAALEALKLHHAGNHTEALARAAELARAHPGSALALNLAGALHRQEGIAAWTNRSPGDEAATALDRHHQNASLDAFSAVAKLAPKCLVTAVAHAEALAVCCRFGKAHKICVALTATHADQDDQDDPALHNARYALLRGSTEKARKCQAMAEADAFKKRFAAVICYHFIPGEAAKLLDANKLAGPAGPQTRDAA